MLNIDRRYLILGALVIMVLVFFAGTRYTAMKDKPADTELLGESASDNKVNSAEGELLQVYVTGEVQKPGVYKLKPGSRIYEALEMAQTLPSADLKQINLARKLEDGEPIVVPAVGDELSGDIAGNKGSKASSASLSAASQSTASGKVNINSATAQEMDDKLPGIGPALAKRIVDYRTSNGSFASIEDIKNVSGIGDKKFEDMKNMITVR